MLLTCKTSIRLFCNFLEYHKDTEGQTSGPLLFLPKKKAICDPLVLSCSILAWILRATYSSFAVNVKRKSDEKDASI